jgi:hypothetical protein
MHRLTTADVAGVRGGKARGPCLLLACRRFILCEHSREGDPVTRPQAAVACRLSAPDRAPRRLLFVQGDSTEPVGRDDRFAIERSSPGTGT